jgi:uncharacterized membrane protein YczE
MAVHQPPRIRGGLVVRLAVLVGGLLLFALGIVSFLESRLGLSPWDVLHQGIARHTALSFGEANIVVSVTVMTIAWLLGAKVGIGTLANSLLVGAFVTGLTAIPAVKDLAGDPLGVRIVLLAAGVLFCGAGSGLYLAAALGAGPRDSLMVVGSQRLRARLAIVRAALELSALGIGIALGGTFGVGTIAFALLIGPSIEAWFWVLRRTDLVEPGPAPAAVPVPAYDL